MSYEYCAYCEAELENKADCCWREGIPFCSDGCADSYDEESESAEIEE